MRYLPQAGLYNLGIYANIDIQSAALLAAIRDYEANKWKHIGQKLGKPAKVES